MKYLIKDGLVLSSKISNGFYKSHVLIEDDVISYIGQSIPATQVDRVIEAKDCLVIPGLVNAHLHSADHFNKGKFDNLPLELWMPLLRPFYSGIGISKDDIYLRTLFGCIEMLKTGTTCIIDDVVQSPFNDEEKLDAIMQAYKKAGIRAYVTTHVSDKSIEDTIPYLKEQFSYYNINAPQPSDTEDIISYVESKLKKYNVNGAVQKYAVAPSGPQRCTDELLVSLSNLSLKYNVPAVCHTLETYVQKKTGDYFYNKTLVKRLYDLKAINQYSNLIHCVWVTDEDIELIRECNGKIVHNPSSNMKLGSGIAPVRKFLDKGIPVGLGTDNTSSNDAINIFLEMREAALIHKVNTKNYDKWIGAYDSLEMGTLGGAKCAGLDSEIGTVEAGKKADIVIIETRNASYVPTNDYVKHLVFAENGSCVRDVFVNGRLVVNDKQITTFNEGEVIDEICELMQKIYIEQDLAVAEAEKIGEALKYAYQKSTYDRQ